MKQKFSRLARRFGHRLFYRLHLHEVDELTGITWCPAGGHDPYNHAGWYMMPTDEFGRVTPTASHAAFAAKGY